MPPVSMPPSEDARSIFRRLGYSVSGDGSEFVAERKWRRVLVTPLCTEDATDPEPYLADGGATPKLRCFVTWRDTAA